MCAFAVLRLGSSVSLAIQGAARSRSQRYAVRALASDLTRYESLRRKQKIRSGDSQERGFESLELKDIGFSDNQDRGSTLEGVCLYLHRGESIGLMPEPESGRSTLVDVMLGLLEPRAGAIFLNKQPMGSVEFLAARSGLFTTGSLLS